MSSVLFLRTTQCPRGAPSWSQSILRLFLPPSSPVLTNTPKGPFPVHSIPFVQILTDETHKTHPRPRIPKETNRPWTGTPLNPSTFQLGSHIGISTNLQTRNLSNHTYTFCRKVPSIKRQRSLIEWDSPRQRSQNRSRVYGFVVLMSFIFLYE